MAHAFDRQQTEQVLARPQSLLCAYCWEETWGGGQGGSSESAVLDLDKAWRDLQWATAPTDHLPARPAYRMFEGEPSWGEGGGRPWVRTLVPEEVPGIARDLAVMDDGEVAARLVEAPFVRPGGGDVEYTIDFLGRARTFMAALAADGRGMVYRIG